MEKNLSLGKGKAICSETNEGKKKRGAGEWPLAWRAIKRVRRDEEDPRLII